MEKMPWPKKGDKLFVEEASPNERAFHLRSYMYSRNQHAVAFKAAADMVIQGAEQASRGKYRDDLLYPVAYLYRHALELKLKEIVRYGIQMHCYKEANVEKILGQHNLCRLWTKAKLAITHRWPDGDLAPVKAVEAVVNEMHQTDRNGQKWRYGTDKDGRPNRHEALPKFVSLKSLRKTMNNVFTFLDACGDGIDNGLQSMRDAMY
jgi:hypothetical protein